MLFILSLENLFAILNPTSRYEVSNLCVYVEMVLAKSYGIPAFSLRYSPMVYLEPKYEYLIHNEIRKIQPYLAKLASEGKVIYVDLSYEGTLILTTENIRGENHHVYTVSVPDSKIPIQRNCENHWGGNYTH